MTDSSDPTSPEAERPLEPPPPPVPDAEAEEASGGTEVATPTKHPAGRVRVLAIIVMAAGLIMMAAGVVTWFVVRDQLSAEQITVSEDAPFAGGEPVEGPFTAYAQAEAINDHALAASDGLTYAQLDQDDPVRNTVMTASFLRASLFTSVVAFGVALFAFAVGILLVLIGWALLRIERALQT